MKPKRPSFTVAGFLLAACLILGLAGSGWAAHPDVQLRDAAGSLIPAGLAPAPAFSMKATCGYCHGDKATYPDLLSYDEIEKHSYHAQLGANQMVEFNPSAAKPWVQSPGHFGKW